MKIFLNKGKRIEFVILIFVVAIIVFLQFIFFKFILAEMIVTFSIGFVLSRMYYGNIFKKDFGKKARDMFFILFFIVWIVASILDPITKIYLDRILNTSTVGTFPTSIFTNCIVFLSFVFGYNVYFIFHRTLLSKIK